VQGTLYLLFERSLATDSLRIGRNPGSIRFFLIKYTELSCSYAALSG